MGQWAGSRACTEICIRYSQFITLLSELYKSQYNEYKSAYNEYPREQAQY